MTDLQAGPRVLHARTAVAAAFFVNGLIMGSFFARTPAVRDALGLSAAQLGLLLLCISIGAITGLPLSGPIVARIGSGRTVLGGALTGGVGLVLVGAGLLAFAVHTAHEAGWWHLLLDRAVDLTWLIDPGSVQSALITGMFGIQPEPTWGELLAFFVYAVPMTIYVCRPQRRPAPPEAVPAAVSPTVDAV